MCSGARAEHGDFDRRERFEAPLAGHLKPPQRLDPVAEQFDPHRLIPIGRENIDDAAARGELSRQADGGRVHKSPLGHPVEQFVDIHFVSDAQPAHAAGKQFARRHRLQQALDAGDDQPGPVGRGLRRFAGQQLEHTEPVAVDFVIDGPFAGGRFPRPESHRLDAGEEREIFAQRIDVARVGRDDDELDRRFRFQRRRGQRAARSPDSTERGPVPRLQGGHHFGEPRVCPQSFGQLQQPARHVGYRLQLHLFSRSARRANDPQSISRSFRRRIGLAIGFGGGVQKRVDMLILDFMDHLGHFAPGR